MRHFLISLDHIAHVAAEAVLVELAAGLDVPQAAAVGGHLVTQHHARGAAGVVLGDEMTPDGCRLWDVETRRKLDKDRFRRDMGDVVEAYQEVAHRLGVQIAD